jgi:hypothetical protein
MHLEESSQCKEIGVYLDPFMSVVNNLPSFSLLVDFSKGKIEENKKDQNCLGYDQMSTPVSESGVCLYATCNPFTWFDRDLEICLEPSNLVQLDVIFFTASLH